MSGGRKDKDSRRDAASDIAREVWTLMSDLVLDHQRRRQVSDAVGLSFSRTRAVRRVAAKPMSMGELAATRRTARVREKLSPTASETCRRRWWSRTRSD